MNRPIPTALYECPLCARLVFAQHMLWCEEDRQWKCVDCWLSAEDPGPSLAEELAARQKLATEHVARLKNILGYVQLNIHNHKDEECLKAALRALGEGECEHCHGLGKVGDQDGRPMTCAYCMGSGKTDQETSNG